QAMKTTPCERAGRQILQSAGNQRFSVQNRQNTQLEPYPRVKPSRKGSGRSVPPRDYCRFAQKFLYLAQNLLTQRAERGIVPAKVSFFLVLILSCPQADVQRLRSVARFQW